MKWESLLYRIWNRPRWVHFAAALAIAIPMVAFSARLTAVFGDQALYLFYSIPIALAAFIGGLWPGLLATTIGFTVGTWHLSQQINRVGSQITPENVIQRGVSFTVVWLFICIVCDLMRNAALNYQRASQERDATRTRLDTILDRMSDSFVSLDNRQTILAANEAFLELAQAKREAVVGRTLESVGAMPGFPIELSIVRDALVAKRRIALDLAELGDGGRWFHVRSFPDATGDAIYIQDITDRKLSESHRERMLSSERSARSRAEEANRMKDELVAITSHELRTPLTTMLGWTEILKSRNEQEELSEGLDQIERSTRQLAQLIDDLLDLSRIATGKLRMEVEVVDLCEVLELVVSTTKVLADQRGVALSLTACDEAFTMGDGARLQQVFSNLVSNALKFTPPGGSVTINVAAGVDDKVIVEVTDTGEGIEPDALESIFVRFRQANSSHSRRHGGLGLGLTIAKEIVDIHEGTLTASSKGLGTGSTFTVTLPLKRVSHEPASPLEEQEGDLGGLNILLVDDDEATSLIFSTILMDAGANVEYANSGPAGLKLLQTFRAKVLVSDIGMPDMDGYEFLKVVRTLPGGSNIRALALTAFASDSDKRKALRNGFDSYLAKPVSGAKLTETILGMLTGQGQK